jgi:hypothetical protein
MVIDASGGDLEKILQFCKNFHKFCQDMITYFLFYFVTIVKSRLSLKNFIKNYNFQATKRYQIKRV